jgi:predicted ribonuclease YlaK
MTKNTYILDTNVLLSDSNSLFGFKEHNVVLPLIVLEELDRHKDRQDEVGRNARDFVRKLSELTKENQDFKKGISIGNNMGTLRILAISDLMQEAEAIEQLPFELQDKKTGDNTIAQFCVNYIHKHKDETVVLITRDTILRLKAKALGIVVEDYKKFNVVTSVSALYSGVELLEDVDGVDVNDFYECGDAGYVLPKEIEEKLYPNQFVIIKCGQQSGVARFIAPGKPLRKMAKNPGKLSPRNKEQEFARELLFDNDVKLVTLAGQAGTGKAQSLDSKVLTPAGWTTMGQIKVGDKVTTRTGKPTTVTGVFPQGEKDIYRVTFAGGMLGGQTTECCIEHLWQVKIDNSSSWTVLPLEQIVKHKDAGHKISVPGFVPLGHSNPVLETVELVGRKPAQCISVEDSEHLYVTDDYIVTHNTLLSIDAGIEQVLNGKRYRSLVICRPVMPVGRDIGFLPGDLNEKLEPWLAPIKDNLRFLLSEFGKKSKFDEQVLQSYFEEGIIEVQAMTFIRGRSIANAFVIIDEAQNTNLHEMKTILTRVGENTKIVLTGDIEQIDNTYVDSVSNGLSIAIERFKSQPIAGHVTFKKGERSQLATIAAEILR